ncbi:hypothetical protein CEXT_225101 [Caerostris extrusa]|uniref:Secreted protein n=1 Tax=Caerostris extrusa TaxID=172846 RepID=A0AAV4N1Q7_CAEEX|nr:hypothetical protein CEXT_225101 [Caerostris extrusa]
MYVFLYWVPRDICHVSAAESFIYLFGFAAQASKLSSPVRQIHQSSPYKKKRMIKRTETNRKTLLSLHRSRPDIREGERSMSAEIMKSCDFCDGR